MRYKNYLIMKLKYGAMALAGGLVGVCSIMAAMFGSQVAWLFLIAGAGIIGYSGYRMREFMFEREEGNRIYHTKANWR